jgi:regulator of replication initiation timing
MNLTVLGVAAGIGLGLGGIYYLHSSRPKADEKTVERSKAPIPGQPGVKDSGKASLCQLLTSYRLELKKRQDELDDLQTKMRNVERQSEDICRVYAQDPVYQYHCNGFPVCGWNEWYTVSGKETNSEAQSLCLTYVKANGTLSQRSHPLKPGGTWSATHDALRDMDGEIAQAYAQLQNLQQQYPEYQRQADQVKTSISGLQKQIADLEAQGVFC